MHSGRLRSKVIVSATIWALAVIANRHENVDRSRYDRVYRYAGGRPAGVVESEM